MRRAVIAVTTVVVLLLGYGVLDAFDLVPGVLTLAAPRDPQSLDPTSTTGSPAGAVPPDQLAQPSAASSAAGLRAAAGGAATANGVAAVLEPLLRDPSLGSISMTVRDVNSGTHLFDAAADVPRIPASVMKLLAAAAIEKQFGHGAALHTTAVGGAAAGQVVLVAGGDSLLAPGAGDPTAVAGRAGLGDLAGQVAARLKAANQTTAAVGLDLTYAPGPLLAPTWGSDFQPLGITAAVAMLGLSTQRATPGHPGPVDPTRAALAAFVAALRARGIDARADLTVTPGAARDQLGSVTSAPVVEQLELALTDSDNGLTETLARQAGFAAGAPTDFPGTGAWVVSTLTSMGIDTAGVHLIDASGLSRGNTVPVRVLADVLTLAANGSVPDLTTAMSGLPIAGLTGTLADRFQAAGTTVADGIVHAKTGTLTGVSSLAGTVVTEDGQQLVFTVIANGDRGTPQARVALDRVVSALVACGCR